MLLGCCIVYSTHTWILCSHCRIHIQADVQHGKAAVLTKFTTTFTIYTTPCRQQRCLSTGTMLPSNKSHCSVRARHGVKNVTAKTTYRTCVMQQVNQPVGVYCQLHFNPSNPSPHQASHCRLELVASDSSVST
jgi:hypothetical protein